MTWGSPVGGPCILLLGMHRSGAEQLAGLLGGMGLRHAPDLTIPSDTDPRGAREPRALVAFDTARLDTLGRHWSDPKPLPVGWADGLDTTEAGTRGLRRALVRYDALIEDWRTTLEATFAALDLPMPQTDPPEALLPRLHQRRQINRTGDLADSGRRIRDAWAPLTTADWAERRDDFDRIASAHRTHWADLSPGPDASDLPDILPAALLEKAEAALARGDGGASARGRERPTPGAHASPPGADASSENDVGPGHGHAGSRGRVGPVD